MGDPVLDRLFNGFGYIFAPFLIGIILTGVSIVSWLLVSGVEKLISNFRLANQASLPPITDTTAREEVLKLRAAQDQARKNRMLRKRQQAIDAVNADRAEIV